MKIISNISKFKVLGFPVLVGVSRKSFLTIDNDLPKDRLAATICANTISILNGADIIRVHDVDEHLKIRSLLSRIKLKNLAKIFRLLRGLTALIREETLFTEKFLKSAPIQIKILKKLLIFRIGRSNDLSETLQTVSYTHLTLPTILHV